MEEDIDIYADLSNFDLTQSKINDQPKTDRDVCNCEELKKKFNSLTIELEDIKKNNENLEKNLASLLKTAKAEIARKDKMIGELRNQLDNTVFRRRNNNKFPHSYTHELSHQHNIVAEKHENVTPPIKSEDDDFTSQQIEPHCADYKSKNTDQVPVTIFGERLYKKILDEKREERKLKAPLKPSSETMNKISDECVAESDKENGSQSSVNYNANESNFVVQSSNSGTSYKNNSGKRLNEEDNMYKSKRLRTENNGNAENIDYNCIVQYETKDNLTKLEDQLHPYKQKREVPLETKNRATSEYRDTKQVRNYRNDPIREGRSSSRDYDDARGRRRFVDSSRNRTSSERLNSDHQHDNYINDHRKNDYRHGASSSRGYSKSSSNYESSSSYRLRERSDRAYRDRKYDDYKYDSRHKSDRSRRIYDSRETDGVRTRYGDRERGDLREKPRHTLSDVEDRENRSSSHRSNKYDNRRREEETVANVSEDKKSHKTGKSIIETDSRRSSSRTIVDTTVDHSVGKCTEQHSVKNELPGSFTGDSSTCVTAKDECVLEEGEILNSPEKTNNPLNTPTDQVMEENVTTAIKAENSSGNTPMDTQTDAHVHSLDLIHKSRYPKKDSPKNCPVTTNQSEYIVETSTKQAEAVVAFSRGNAEGHEEPMQLNPPDGCTTIDVFPSNFVWNTTCNRGNLSLEELSHEHVPYTLQDYVEVRTTTPEKCPVSVGNSESNNNHCDSDERRNYVEGNFKDCTSDSFVRSEETSNLDKKRTIRSDNANTEDTVELDKVNDPETDNDVRQVCKDVKSSTSKEATRIESNCDNVDDARDHVSNRNETSHQIPDNNNAEASHSCLGDHNYVRDSIIDGSDLDTVPSISGYCKSVSDTATKKAEAEEAVNAQSIDTKKTTSTSTKNKKNQNSKAIIISRRRKPVTLSDNNASMTVVISANLERDNLAVNNISDKSDPVSKPRACKLARSIKPPSK